ncbi:ABC transporter permease [Virgibacillus byunsanensis]|uniref:ABC transporter permease n=1 Tax=Virgibacillus byunsanensis TaxID=570945 RepID=A0ABW3LNU7_9BACI
MQWTTLFKKEMLENWRNFKWVWVPLVMILIAVVDPISSYYLPQIIESVGGMPEGAVFEMPEFAPSDVVMMSLSQISSLGVLVIALMSMGTISSERKSGVSELILVKPVSYHNYITAKWASLLLLVWTAFFLGMLGSWYYVNILFGELSFLTLLAIVFYYGLWLTLVISLSIFYNTVFKTAGLVAFMTIITIMLMSVITQVFGHILEWSPNNISEYIQEMLITESLPSDLIATGLVTISIIALLLISSIYTFKTKELAN